MAGLTTSMQKIPQMAKICVLTDTSFVEDSFYNSILT